MVVDDQSDVVTLLSAPGTYGADVDRVERVETHSAIVFLAGTRAFKLKRAVRYDYLDFSTPERRHRFADAEVALNRRSAPSLYRGVVAVTREPDGRLRLGGTGTAVDWVVEMVRFDDAALCDRLAERGALPLTAMPALARAIAALHEGAAARPDMGGRRGMQWVIDGNTEACRAFGPGVFALPSVEALDRASRAALDRTSELLETRRAAGLVRQCHGDLHLRNLVMIDGTPTPFDAVEFNDEIACVDVAYDLAFLLMDLWRRGLHAHANVVHGEYLRRTGDVAALAALPLFLSCRAAVRAKTGATTAALLGGDARATQLTVAREYLAMAAAFLAPPPARLMAVGGASGSGKSVLAAAIAPSIGPVPGAWVLRSDVERKRLFGAAEGVRLGPDAYGPEPSARVHAHLRTTARLALHSGHAVVCDAVFGAGDERIAIARVAAEAGVPFVGLWLDAPLETRVARVTTRQGDASDADGDVVRQQDATIDPPADWIRVDATGDADATLAAARSALDARARATSP